MGSIPSAELLAQGTAGSSLEVGTAPAAVTV